MRTAVAALAATALLLAGCTSDADEPEPSPSAAPAVSPSEAATEPAGPAAEGFSTPVEDPVYPDVGDPGVDTLHYDLRLAWEPRTRTLTGVETVDLRATADADQLQLDLGEALEVSAVTVDGQDVPHDHRGKDLVVRAPVTAGQRYAVEIRYAGTPEPVPAPVERRDFSSTGWTVTDDGGAWTMQEPFGAFTWYAVNDQPSDKALYDVTLRVPSPMVGVSNGELLSRRDRAGTTVTRWRLDEPAASYLVTVALGDFTLTEDESPSGVPITYWTPPDRPDLLERLRATPAALDWVEERLGAYPYDTLGVVVVDSRSGMETQTMITLGDTRYATSEEVLVHEIVHHWYGDLLTPETWRDMWMNEGMATYLQGVWRAEDTGQPVESIMDTWAGFDPQLRAAAGPPADYDPDSFGDGNVYYSAAVMWDEVRKRLGDEEFWRLVREWPTAEEDGSADYEAITSWWSAESGEDLSGVFDAWLLGESTPERDAVARPSRSTTAAMSSGSVRADQS